jgi:hypothetical protein
MAMTTQRAMTLVLFGLMMAGCDEEQIMGGGGGNAGSGTGAAGAAGAPASTPAAAGTGGTGSATSAAAETGAATTPATPSDGNGASTTKSIDRFIGTWKYTSGSVTRICAGVTETFQLTGSDEEFAHSVDGGLTLKGDCATRLTIAGDTASAAPGATCTQVKEDGSSSTLMYSSLAYSTTDGRNMTVASSGIITFLDYGASLACTFSITGNLVKYAD